MRASGGEVPYNRLIDTDVLSACLARLRSAGHRRR
jgi:hypothetical protein